MVRSTAPRAVPLLLLALVCALGGAASAPAATTTLQPSPAEARTFATTNGGWSSAVDYNGLVCIPGVTCPTANPTYQATGGAGGAGDGFLRNSFGTLLGVLSTTTINWTSPTFVAPSGTDTATLTFKVRPQIASLLAIGSVNVTPAIVDVDDGTQTTVLPARPLTAASASFGELSFGVPAGAVVAGRSYRVRIGTALTTSVSAVTSGNVDLDDVQLALTDLTLPTGLTASVPATGPTRVTGSVNPEGTSTEVVVDYGLTTAYGTTTAPVTVSGTTSQPFSIPLSGLTPGATYNYRVRATNPDGTVSTTNATFVAPTPPDNAPPTVTGAGNVRNRTVTYARGADVADATVQLLGPDDQLIESFPDVDGDGSVTVTLPDADGSYGVRVVRSNAAGQSSTSATVPAVLDRAAPDVSALGLTVTPTVSDATQRTVSFNRPADAASVVAQVIDASGDPVGLPVTVLADTATVTVGPGDGSYRVRLTLTDAAGNPATATSDPVTLDTAAPDAGPAPTVTGDGNSRERTVTFTRDPTATTVAVEIVNGSGTVIDTVSVPTGASTAITLPNQDGVYGVRVRQADAAGNADTTPTTSVALDRSAPDLSGLALSVTPALSNDRSRTVTIVRPEDAATVTAQVIDASGDPVGSPVTIAGTTGTVTLGTADGSYRVRVTVADAAGNSDSATSTPVTLDATAPNAGPAPTVTGDGDSRTRTVAFTRDPTATTVAIELLGAGGAVIDTIPVPSGGSGTITLPDADGDYGVRIRQTDAAGNAATTPTTDVTLDRVAPDLSALALAVAPAVSNDRDRTVTLVRPAGAATITAQVIDASGDPVGSPVTISGTTGTITLGSADGSYRVRVTVADATGNSDSATSDPVTLDTTAPDAGPAPTVSGADDSRTREVTFVRDPSAATVVIELLDGSGQVIDTVTVPSGDRATVTLPDGNGDYGVRIRQTDAAGNSAVSAARTVALQRTDPGPGPGDGGGGTGGGGTGGGATGGGQAVPPGPTAPAACAKPALLLTRVALKGGRVQISGWTTRAAGTEVRISDLGGKRIGTAEVGANGTFSVTAKAPTSAAKRARAGYRAVVGRHRSPAVKLRRVNELRTVAAGDGTVTLRGRVGTVRRLGRFTAVAAYGGTGDCPTINKRLTTVGTPKINRRTGVYTLRVRVPAGTKQLVVKTRVTVGGGNYHSTHVVR
jgi:hypothetical protein